jgi:hypothetical protein
MIADAGGGVDWYFNGLLCQQYPGKRPVVATAGARLNDCKVSETVSSRAGGDRLLTLHSCRSGQRREDQHRGRYRVHAARDFSPDTCRSD